MDYTQLLNTIQGIIRNNGNEEITGDNLQAVLTQMVQSIGKYSTFVGVATPDTIPSVYDGNVFFVAATSGTYTNFDGFVLDSGIAFFFNTQSGWHAEVLDIPSSDDLITLSASVESLTSRIDAIQTALNEIQVSMRRTLRRPLFFGGTADLLFNDIYIESTKTVTEAVLERYEYTASINNLRLLFRIYFSDGTNVQHTMSFVATFDIHSDIIDEYTSIHIIPIAEAFSDGAAILSASMNSVAWTRHIGFIDVKI